MESWKRRRNKQKNVKLKRQRLKKEKKATAKKSSKKQANEDESSSDSDYSSVHGAVLPPAADRKAQTRGVDPKEALDVGGNSANHLHNTHCCIDVFIDEDT